MKHFTLTLTAAAAAALMAVGCQEKPENGSVSLHSDAQMTLPAAATDTTISFTATADWTASVEGGEWLTVSPSAGEAGEISAEVSASANSETASRTATVRISCGTDQVSVTVAQDGAAGEDPSEPEEPEAPEEPEQPAGKMPRSILIEQLYDGAPYDEGSPASCTWTFEYDDQGRMSSIHYADEFPYPQSFNFEYREGEVIMSDMGRFIVDEEGKATAFETDDMRWDVTYDQDGYLKDVNSGKFTYTWENGDLSLMTYNDQKYSPVVTEYENTGYLDFNLFLSYLNQNEGVTVGFTSLLGLVGNRSAHIFLPSTGLYDGDRTVGDEDYKSFMNKNEFSEEETQRTWSWTYVQYTCSIDDLTGDIEFDADGDMTRALSRIPMTVTTYSQSAEISILNPEDFYLDGNYKYYYRDNLEITISEPVPVGEPRETEQILTVTVTYY